MTNTTPPRTASGEDKQRARLAFHIKGCLLGTAVGDALGLPRENLSRRRAARMHGTAPLEMALIAGRGFCSDDTEHTAMVARALAQSAGDIDVFQRSLARQLRTWLLTAPAGVGKATLQACLRLCCGISPDRSGVRSAGNGPAMRAALFGFCGRTIEETEHWNLCSARMTHTDPRAIQGAAVVARTAFLLKSQANAGANDRSTSATTELLRQAIDIPMEPDLREVLASTLAALEQAKTAEQFADERGWNRGVTGFVNQTVPAAVYCWAAHRGDFRAAVESAVLLGGDTDSVAAITAAIAGGELGAERIPVTWLSRLAEWPRGVDWLENLAECLARTLASEGRNDDAAPNDVPSMHWWLTLPRNLVFATIVIVLALRRLFPPY